MIDEQLSMLYSQIKINLHHQNFSSLRISLFLGLFLHSCTLKYLTSHNGQIPDLLSVWKRKVIKHLQISTAAIFSNCTKPLVEVAPPLWWLHTTNLRFQPKRKITQAVAFVAAASLQVNADWSPILPISNKYHGSFVSAISLCGEWC